MSEEAKYEKPPEVECLLPTTAEALDEFVDVITKEYELPPGDDTYDAIATMILHLPQTRAFMPHSYFGHGVLKSMANKAAFDKLQGFAIKRKEAEEKKKAALSLVPTEVETVGAEPLQNA